MVVPLKSCRNQRGWRQHSVPKCGVVMSEISVPKILSGLLATLALSVALVLLFSSSSAADTPYPPIDAPFTAPTCAGNTFEDPNHNAGFAVVDLTQVFDARLTPLSHARLSEARTSPSSSLTCTAWGCPRLLPARRSQPGHSRSSSPARAQCPTLVLTRGLRYFSVVVTIAVLDDIR